MLTSFLVGIASSVVAAIILATVSKWRQLKLFMSLSGSSFFKHGIEFVYDNQAAAVKDIVADIEKSKNIRIFCIRGYSFIQADREFSFILDDTSKKIRFLLADPRKNSEMAFRAMEVPNKTTDTYCSDLKNNLKQLENKMRVTTHIECRLHYEPAVFRIFLFDSRLYLSFFQPDKTGNSLQIFRIKRSSGLYIGIARYFDRVWEKSKPMAIS